MFLNQWVTKTSRREQLCFYYAMPPKIADLGKIFKKIDDWKKELLDLSNRNPLLNCKIGEQDRDRVIEIVYPNGLSVWEELVTEKENGATSLTFAWKNKLLGIEELDEELPESEDKEQIKFKSDEERINACIKSGKMKSKDILTRLPDKKLGVKLKNLAKRSNESLSEQGVNVLFLTFGLLNRKESASSPKIFHSPIFLVPVTLEQRSLGSAWTLSLAENDPILNLSLAELLEKEFSLTLPPIPETGFDKIEEWSNYLINLNKAISQSQNNVFRDWSVEPRSALGIFGFQKIAMWRDLTKNAERIANHPICRAIANGEYDATNGEYGVTNIDLPHPKEFDKKTDPKEFFSILDCDSSQFEAILAVKRGMNLIIDGPPGTGKSQTIANIIAETIAYGKKVLFVSEKAAALEVVKRRLEQSQIDDFCIDCHNVKKNKRSVIEEIGRCLNLPQEKYADQDQTFRDLIVTREELNSYVEALHASQGKMKWTAFRVCSEISALKEKGTPVSNCTIRNPLRVDADEYYQCLTVIDKIPLLEHAIEHYRNNPWQDCTLDKFHPLLQENIERKLNLLVDTLNEVKPALGQLSILKCMPENPSCEEWEVLLVKINTILQYTPVSPQWFENGTDKNLRNIEEIEKKISEYERYRDQHKEFSEDDALTVNIEELSISVDFIQKSQSISSDSPNTLMAWEEFLKNINSLLAQCEKDFSSLKESAFTRGRELGLEINDNTILLSLGKAQAAILVLLKSNFWSDSWLDERSRNRLREIKRLYAEKEKTHRIKAGQLSQSFNDKGMGAQGYSLAKDVDNFRSFWKRMPWSREWRSFRKASLALYHPDSLPQKMTILFDELDSIVEYGRMNEILEQELSPHREHIPLTQNGEYDWDRLEVVLDALEKIESLIPISELLSNSIKKSDPRLHDYCDSCNKTISMLMKWITQISEYWKQIHFMEYTIPAALTSFGEIQTMIDQANKMTSTFSDHLHTLKSANIISGPDISITDVQKRIDHARELQNRRNFLIDSQDAVMRELGLEPENGDDLYISNLLAQKSPHIRKGWSTVKNQAESFKAMLKDFGKRVTLLVSLVSDEGNRSRLLAAYEQAKRLISDEFLDCWKSVWENFDGIVAEKIRLSEIFIWVKEHLDTIDLLPGLVRLNETINELKIFKLDSFCDEIMCRFIHPRLAVDAFKLRFRQRWLEDVYHNAPQLAQFHMEEHEGKLEKFRKSDSDYVHKASQRIREKLLAAPDRPHLHYDRVSSSSELGIIRREMEKKRRHLSLRQLFNKCPGILQKIKPCMMMSPLAVSTMLDSSEYEFDLVIFDEASQVNPWDAIGAIYRGKQLVVAGDQQQLPPSNYFRTSIDDTSESEDDNSITDYSSILDVAKSIGMEHKRLKWHYRSRREQLIAFSNKYYYDNELITFPSVDDTESRPAVEFHYVKNGIWCKRHGQTDKRTFGRSSSPSYNPVEAKETARLVLEHVRKHPEKSLGVITCNITQQDIVEGEVELLRSKDSKFNEFFKNEKDEPFFIKNLETVQGDERDVIIFGIGYGRNEEGKILMNFGPLNNDGGERRLNVAVTRAREKVHLISSIRSNDIDLSRVSKIGPQRLKEYLEYAEYGPKSLSSTVSPNTATVPEDYDTEFERQVAKALEKQGLTVHAQIGCGGFRIDLAIIDPTCPDRYVLGIECDGATYHRSATARDRDRLRQNVLEGLGWKIVRVWSSEWMNKPEKQVDRIIRHYHARLKQLQEEKPIVTPTPPPPIDGPEIFTPPPPKQYDYKDIKDVPSDVVATCIIDQLNRCGKTRWDQLVDAVARQLGFKRTGSNIKQCITHHIGNMISLKKLKLMDNDEYIALSQ